MANANSQFGGFLTTVGVAKQTNANALQIPWKITSMQLGDGGGEPAQVPDPTPHPDQTALIRVVHDAPLNALYPSPDDPGILIAELVLPPNVGGWWIRESALKDEDGDLIAVAAPAPSYKPLLVQNSGRTQTIRMHVVFGNTANITLKIDPSIVLATRAEMDRGDTAAREYAKQLVENAATEATQEEAEDGLEGTKKMTPRRVLQAIRSAAAKATEVLRGVLRIATQEEVDAGALDDVAVTPKKLRHGLMYSFGTNGYFFLPSWLTGFGFQWRGITMQPSSREYYALPIAFPVSHFISVGNIGIPAQGNMYITPGGLESVYVQHTYTTVQAGYVLSVGR